MNELQRVRELLQTYQTAVLATYLPDGSLHARPMAIAQVEPNANLWFFTGLDTAKAAELQADSRATAICQDGWSSCIVVSGKARLERNPGKVAELWKESFRTWFPQGQDDPNLVLIHLAGADAEFWDNTGMNKLRYVYEASKAYLSGQTPDVKEGDQHGRVKVGAT